MLLEKNEFEVWGEYDLLPPGEPALVAVGSLEIHGPAGEDKAEIFMSNPASKTICIGRFTGDRVMPGHISALIEMGELERPDITDSTLFFAQHRSAILALGDERRNNPNKSAMIVFPNAPREGMSGKDRYRQAVIGVSDGEPFIFYESCVPWNSNLNFAFVRVKTAVPV
jgi:hypothetical protein